MFVDFSPKLTLIVLTGYEFKIIKSNPLLTELEEKSDKQLKNEELKLGILYLGSTQFTDAKLLDNGMWTSLWIKTFM